MRTTMRSESTLVPPVTARPVAAALADDRGGLAGDGGLVDRGDALDDLAVAGDELARLDDHEVALAQLRGRHRPPRCPSTQPRAALVSLRILRSVSAWALPRPSAIASAKLAKSTVNQSQSVTAPVNQSGVPRSAGASEVAHAQRGW